jgi:hypothetical protein
MIKKDKAHGYQSIACACGSKMALLEKLQYVNESKNIYKIIEIN